MRTREQNEKIASAVGQFLGFAETESPFPTSEGRGKLEKALLVFCAAVQDTANQRVERATEDLRDRFAQAALIGLAGELPSKKSYEEKGEERQAKDATEIATRVWVLAEAVMEGRR